MGVVVRVLLLWGTFSLWGVSLWWGNFHDGGVVFMMVG